MRKDIHPNKINKAELPLIVLSDHSSGFFEWVIKFRTKANYNHIMTMIYPGEFASQGNKFSLIPFDRYMTKYSRLKFWKIKDLTKDERTEIKKRIIKRLTKKRPWWRRLSDYDYIGVIGQALGIRKINNPLKTYCSEQVKSDVLVGIIELEYIHDKKYHFLPRHPSPKDINSFFKNHPRMEVFTRWASD